MARPESEIIRTLEADIHIGQGERIVNLMPIGSLWSLYENQFGKERVKRFAVVINACLTFRQRFNGNGHNGS